MGIIGIVYLQHLFNDYCLNKLMGGNEPMGNAEPIQQKLMKGEILSSRYLDIVYEDLRIEYNHGVLVAREYKPKFIENTKFAVVEVLGMGEAINVVDDEGNFDGDNHDAPAIKMAQRGGDVIVHNDPDTGILARSTGKFTIPHSMDGTDAVYKRLKEIYRKNLFANARSYGAYKIMSCVQERAHEYAAVSLLNPLLSFEDFYNEYPFGETLVKICRNLEDKPEFFREAYAKVVFAFFNYMMGIKGDTTKRHAHLRFEKGYPILEESLKAPALYDIIKEFETPLLVQQCVNDGVLFLKPMDKDRKKDLKNKFEGMVKDKNNLEFKIIGELGKEGDPNHGFEKNKKPYTDPELDVVVDYIVEFFDNH